MRRDSLSTPILIIGSALLCASGAAQALGFGRVISASWLGQPLNFAAAVRLEADETLGRECVSAEVLSGDSHVPPAAVRLTVEPGADAGERLVRITTMTQIDEPVVTVTVSAGCNVRLTRSFVTLMDPPGMNLAQSGAPAPTLPPQRLESQVAPVVTVVQAEEAASAAPRPAPPRREPAPVRPRAAPSSTTAVARVPPAMPETARPPRKAPAPRVAAARPATGGPRLQLEAGTAAAVAASAAARNVATAAASPPLPVAAAAPTASAPDVQAAALAASAASAADAAQQRVAALEENIEHLREESQKTQKALATLEATLKDAQASRYSNPLVYGLAWLSALLTILVAALWWRQSQARSSQWWLAPAAGGAPPVRPAVPRPAVPETGGGRLETEPAVMDDRATMRTLTDVELRRKLPVETPPAPTVVLADPPVLRRELSVEELIDLEQQADFFVVLGQDDAAIDLLMGHVRSSGGVSPLPYLKLLEIYRRRGEHESYDRIRERFNRRFSAYAPDWDADLTHGQALEDYPKILMQLQRLWDEPSRITHMLDATLMRQDGSGETFDLPAYRELLFLYSIARDLAEHPAASGPVDLLLPLEADAGEKPIEQLTASRLMGFASTDHATLTVDLDVTAALPPDPDAPASDFQGLVDPRLKDG